MYGFRLKYEEKLEVVENKQNQELPECLELLAFWTKMQLEDEEQKSWTPIMLIITDVFWWFWWQQWSLYHTILRNFDPGRGYSNIFASGTMGDKGANAWGTQNFEPGRGYSTILWDDKFHGCEILSFAGDQWQKVAWANWGHTIQNLGAHEPKPGRTLTGIEILS